MKKKTLPQSKFKPVKQKTYLVTDSCAYEAGVSEDYNPYDAKRRPHAIELIDVESGTVVFLKSGSLVKIIKGII